MVPSKDDDVILAVGNDRQFAALCGVLGKPAWANDIRFATNAARVANRHALIELMSEVTKMATTREWVVMFEKAGVPCGPINNLKDVFEDPHVIEDVPLDEGTGLVLVRVNPQ